MYTLSLIKFSATSQAVFMHKANSDKIPQKGINFGTRRTELKPIVVAVYYALQEIYKNSPPNPRS